VEGAFVNMLIEVLWQWNNKEY